ncbi:hypothetical protein OBBRIDRAFT_834444 [Obba rivulosa]|uniref:Uncharacterized protein n=1 Tax=Obba rivulosa TaxID=1052685 RepID=A0A8E2AVN3_9APHY|nr:hypothetical protein OBBRIDRAFT_834444 [Obba rivulosa]
MFVTDFIKREMWRVDEAKRRVHGVLHRLRAAHETAMLSCAGGGRARDELQIPAPGPQSLGPQRDSTSAHAVCPPRDTAVTVAVTNRRSLDDDAVHPIPVRPTIRHILRTKSRQTAGSPSMARTSRCPTCSLSHL